MTVVLGGYRRCAVDGLAVLEWDWEKHREKHREKPKEGSIYRVYTRKSVLFIRDNL